MFEKWQFFVLKINFSKMPKKVKVSPKVDILCPKGESNPGPLACQSRALPQDHGGWWENLAIFHRYISNGWKNQLTLKKTATCQTHFGFTNMGSNMYQFRRGAIWNKKFRFGSPCTRKSVSEARLNQNSNKSAKNVWELD